MSPFWSWVLVTNAVGACIALALMALQRSVRDEECTDDDVLGWIQGLPETTD